MDEPENKDTSPIWLSSKTLTSHSANTQERNLSPIIAQSKIWADLNLKPNSKITLRRARTVDNHPLTDDELTSPDQIPDHIFKRLMIANYHAREFKVKPITLDKHKLKDIYDSDEDEDEDEGINPMDALLGIFHCSDASLRRYLALKLSACQLSIPFLLPDPEAPCEKITILLSALESITKSWKEASDENESVQQVFATEHPFPVVSFIRIGNPTMSKSSLINKIMSDGNSYHDFFFHKDNRGGDVERRIVDGLVELSWYLPGGSKKQTLRNEICFANLRGDAKDFKKQLHLLLNISSVLCILLPSTYPVETIKKTLEDATQNKPNVILIFNEKSQTDAKKYFKDFMSKQNKKFTSRMRARQPNEHEFVKSIRESIQKNIKKAKPLVELASCASVVGIHLDQDQSHSDFEKNANSWLRHGIKEVKDLLKLQMHIPKLADLERERSQPKLQTNMPKTNHVKRDVVEVCKDIEAEQNAQKESFVQLDVKVFDCLNSIATMDEAQRSYALNRLKHQLDKMSLQFMARLHKKYVILMKNETPQKHDTPTSESEYLMQLEETISKWSFGLEHIIRELAQLYQLDESRYDYAGAAAEMLLSGQPLELLDGDSFYIPLEWFNAVYSKLELKTKNAKIFVISVVGIQSSGKSTMLNTMFGLELQVSAGRCTRGVFASLIPVSDSLKSTSSFEYILIVDTEGLSGSADHKSQEHDKELATFAIGVADLTIVNIFGENYNEMKEFLEIAVRGLLNINVIKEKKSCKIVHQNVGATDAEEKLTDERFDFKQDLDEMIKLAAIQENCEDRFRNFNDVMSFDENEDVFYIPSLLQGSPPMAPVNPEYGEAVQRIKTSVITLMCSKEIFKHSICQFREMVCNLWQAMLTKQDLQVSIVDEYKSGKTSLGFSNEASESQSDVVYSQGSEAVQTVNLPGREHLPKHLSSNLEKEKDELVENGRSKEAFTTTPKATAITNQEEEQSSTRNAPSKFRSDFHVKDDSNFTLRRVRTVDNHTLTEDELTSADQIPDYILKSLMIVDCNVREFELKPLTSNRDQTEENYDSDEEEDEDEDEHQGVNPMDALLDIFHRSDVSLRRYLALKLSSCQLSIPFLLPDPEAPSEKITILISTLESITKSWKEASEENESVQQVFATEHPFPVVSFIRVGEPSMSKSSLINKIMSDGNSYHDCFFHKDIKGGNIHRKVVDGLVELSWYLPGGNKKQTLQNEICFANLRGDAKDFKKQLHLLINISSVLCILLPSKYPDETIKKILEDATQNNPKVILIFNEKAQTDAKKYFKDFMSKHNKKFTSTMRARQSNEHEFVENIRENIQMNIKEVTAKPLVELASCASEYSIQLDEDQSHSDFEKNVDSWLKQGIVEAKDLLKLQQHVPTLADMEREIYRPKRLRKIFSNDGVGTIYERIEAEKDAQTESFKKLDKRILDCLNSIAIMNEAERNNALNKLKHQLDKISLQFMAGLRKQDQKKNLETPQKSEGKRIKQLPQNSCSFGLEHIIRELAQLYQLDESQYDCAGAAAEMLLSGQPLELLDGDSFYIPLEWFNAVCRKLEQKTKNSKLLVISVIGIQSSGKSTMLNTMFGLEFPVSAGGCTRGVFASLIPVSDSLKSDSGFDYVLVIDTEGLSGSGNPQFRERDNEFATFAIGVADVTIVNIFGSNHNEVKEFLEIVVHAFLKMNLVGKKKACKIVHQNVAATDANDKFVVNRFKLKLDLNEMVKLAVTRENCEDKSQTFKGIVSFNEKEDVFYIPRLLKGNPPMAPVNPDYGRGVLKVKESIFTAMCSNEIYQRSVCQFREGTTNLWETMKMKNFIFGFRSTIEVRARMSLDRHYSEESLNLMVIGMTKLQDNINIDLKRCTTRNERVEKWEMGKRQIREEAEEFGEKMRENMKVFFEANEDKKTLDQWREDVMKKIENLKETRVLEVTKNCLATFHHLQNLQDIEDEQLTCEEKLLEKAKKFITQARDIEDKETLKTIFGQEWQQWILDVRQSQGRKININSEMISFLCDKDSVRCKEMEEKLTKQNNIISNFKGTDIMIDVDDLTYVGFVETNSVLQTQQQSLPYAKRIKKSAIKKALDFARKSSESGVRFTRNELAQMYGIVITTIDEETKKFFFKFKNSLTCDVLLCTFADAYNIFAEMEERFWRQRDLRGDLERNLRPRLEKYFGNVSKKMRKEILAATSFVDVLEKQIESSLNQIVGSAMAEVMLKESKYQSKGQFHVSVLIQLGEEGKFESYIPYLENPLEFLKTKFSESVQNYCVNETQSSITLLLEDEVKKIENDVFASLSTATKETKNGSKKLSFWIQRFVDECSTLVVKKEMFAVAAIDDLEDVEVFQSKIREKITHFAKSLIERGVDHASIRKWNSSILECLFNHVFTCQCYCPFCDALCDRTIPNHDKHSTLFHRPKGMIGVKIERELDTNICTESIAGKKDFRNSSASWGRLPYKDYQSVNDYYNSWDTPADSSSKPSKYWQWFMATFSKELAEHYGANVPNIPKSWKRLKFSEAGDQLREEYHL